MFFKVSTSVVLFFFIFASKASYAQKADTLKKVKNSVYFDIGKQMMYSISYERALVNTKYYIFSAQAGYGDIPGDNEPKEPPYHILITGFHNLIGTKGFYLQVGLAPTVYFYNHSTFVNLDGDFGIRYQGSGNHKFFAQLTYNPILYTNRAIKFDLPIGVGMGVRW